MSRQHKPRPRAAAVMAAITDPLTVFPAGWGTGRVPDPPQPGVIDRWLPIIGPAAAILLGWFHQGWGNNQPITDMAWQLGVNDETLRRAIARLNTFNILDVRDGAIALRHVNNPPAHLVNRRTTIKAGDASG